jgi:competence ComEA-like helix-hairpin-helix protein
VKQVLISAGLLIVVAGFAPAQELPEAKGKKQVEAVCNACHEANVVFKYRTAKDNWQNTVDDMVSRGADASKEDLAAIVDYLARCFGPEVNVNMAAADDLAKQLEISGEEAAAIVKYRKDNGDFKELASLAKVPGLDMKKLEPVKLRIVF